MVTWAPHTKTASSPPHHHHPRPHHCYHVQSTCCPQLTAPTLKKPLWLLHQISNGRHLNLRETYFWLIKTLCHFEFNKSYGSVYHTYYWWALWPPGDGQSLSDFSNKYWEMWCVQWFRSVNKYTWVWFYTVDLSIWFISNRIHVALWRSDYNKKTCLHAVCFHRIVLLLRHLDTNTSTFMKAWAPAGSGTAGRTTFIINVWQYNQVPLSQ